MFGAAEAQVAVRTEEHPQHLVSQWTLVTVTESRVKVELHSVYKNLTTLRKRQMTVQKPV